MSTYWIIVVFITSFSALSVWLYNFLLIRTESLLIRFLLKFAIMWFCTLLPVLGINVVYRHYHEVLFDGARGASIAIVFIIAFLTHIVLLAKKDREIKHQ